MKQALFTLSHLTLPHSLDQITLCFLNLVSPCRPLCYNSDATLVMECPTPGYDSGRHICSQEFDRRMQVNLNQLKVFCEVVERNGFTRAAEALYLTQPAVSRQVRELEKHFGVELFEQIGKRIYPTEAGNTLYSYARQVFHTLDDLEVEVNQLKGLKAGHLRLAASATAGTYLLPSLLGRFKRKYPGVEVTLEIHNSQQVEQRLLQYQQLDLGVIEQPVQEEALFSAPFLTDELVVIVSPDHPFAGREMISVEELRDERFILREEGAGTRTLLDEEFARLDIRVKTAMQLGGAAAIKQAVAAGLGISVVSIRAIQLELAAGTLRAVRCPEMRLTREVRYVHHRDKRLSRAASAFLEILKAGNKAEAKTH